MVQLWGTEGGSVLQKEVPNDRFAKALQIASFDIRVKIIMSYGFEKERFARFCMIPPPFHFVTQIRPFLNHAEKTTRPGILTSFGKRSYFSKVFFHQGRVF